MGNGEGTYFFESILTLSRSKIDDFSLFDDDDGQVGTCKTFFLTWENGMGKETLQMGN